MLNDREQNAAMGRQLNYYEDLGRAHDCLLRCKDCKALVTYQTITKLGSCDKCGNKRFVEITLLSEQEMADIQSGVIDFPARDKFLKEFTPVAEAA